MTAKTPAERQAAYRARKAATPEVRGIFARPENHAAIKAYAAGLKPLSDKQFEQLRQALERAGQ